MQHPLPPHGPTAWGRPTGGEEAWAETGLSGMLWLAGRQSECVTMAETVKKMLQESIRLCTSSLESPRPLHSKWKQRINFLLGARLPSFFFPTRPQTLPISPIKLLLTEPFKLQCRILHCLIHLTQPQLIKLDAIWWESTVVIHRDGDTLNSLPGAQHRAHSLHTSVLGAQLAARDVICKMLVSSNHPSSGKVAVALNTTPSSLKGTNCPLSFLASGCSPIPSWCSKRSVSQGHCGSWGYLVLGERKEERGKKKPRWRRSVHGEMCQYLNCTGSWDHSPGSRSLCNDEDYN